MAALNKANARANVAISIDDGKTKKEVINLGNALPAGFVPPPRSIADIAAVLDNEKPDPATLAKLKDEADDEPDPKQSVSDLAELYYERATARLLLGRYAEAAADAEKALAIASKGGDPMLKQRIRQFVGMQKKLVGDLKGSIATFQQLFAETDNRPGLGGWLFNSLRNIAEVVLLSGDIAQAEGYMRRLESKIVEMRTSGIPQKREAYAQRGRAFESDLESVRAVLFEARGNYRDAEAAYKKATDYRRGWIQDSKKTDYPPPESQIRQNVDSDLLNVARMKAKQGRLAEAEVDARAVLLNRLKEQGKYNPLTTQVRHGSCRHSDRARAIPRCRKTDPLRAGHPAHPRHQG